MVTAKKHRTEESTATDRKKRKKNQDKLKGKKYITRQRLSKIINSAKSIKKQIKRKKEKPLARINHVFSSEYTSKT